MMTPCGMYMNPRRTGGLYAFSSLLPPSPWNPTAARREKLPLLSGRCDDQWLCFYSLEDLYVEQRLVSIPLQLVGCRLLGSTMREGVTGDDRSDECLHAVAILSDLLHQIIHHDFVIAFQPSAQGIG